MVAKIIISKNIEKALNYNEHKMQKGQAECIHAGNFLKEAENMNFYEKLSRFNDLISRNDRATTNSLHISLNFDPSENLSEKELTAIANSYISKIGFQDQPYLVYQHIDAGHPHIHIVTTNIEADGSRINTHNIGRNQSEKARKEIEQEFKLVRASGRSYTEAYNINPVDARKVVYGKSETKRSITNVLDAVINQYKYTSIAELNAVLKQYNVMADRGKEESRIYKNGGLVYRVIDEQGNKIGVPIKASSIYSKPTLKYLQNKFSENEEKRKSHRQRLKELIDQILPKPGSMQEFIREMRKKGIAVVLRQNEKGFIYGITFVDHNSKSVFNGSELGKPYTATAIQQRINQGGNQDTAIQEPDKATIPNLPKATVETDKVKEKISASEKSVQSTDILEQLMNAEKDFANTPFELKKRRRGRRKRKPDL